MILGPPRDWKTHHALRRILNEKVPLSVAWVKNDSLELAGVIKPWCIQAA